MSAMTAVRVEHVGLGRGLGMGVDRRASGGRASAVPRARRRAVIARVQGAEGERTVVKRERSAFRADTHARGTARVRPMRALGGSFDETDPETALKASSETVEEASEGEGSMTEVAVGRRGDAVRPRRRRDDGRGKAEEYFSGYLLEQSLSVDNLFVFVLVFDYFKVPMKQQQKVLSYDSAARWMRAAMIVAGTRR